jgi:cytochrome c-type biogenesis protein CcsB|tara:strand:+ start:20330 stop:21301 length:972 start_codon:yes stop_codon:yes gene_type:complete
MDIQSLLDNVIFLNLLLLTISYWASLIFPKIKFLVTTSYYGNIFANLSLFSLLSLRWLNFGYFPLSNLYESLLFLAWGITFITAVVENKSQVNLVGSISTPIALFVTGFASLSLPESMQAPAPLVPALKSNWLMMHVTVMMLSYASLIVGSLLGIFFLILAKGKNKKIELQGNSYGTQFTNNTNLIDTAFYKTDALNGYENLLTDSQTSKTSAVSERLNLLESIDNLSYRTISFGFPLLTIGIIAGAVWANEAWGSYWSWDPKETWALITWLVFASYLHARLTKSWQGEKPAMIASLGFIVVWICYLGVNFLGKGLHTYGQIL